MKMLEVIASSGVAGRQGEMSDGQPKQRGLHLRWSFAPQLGFPPGGFWLCRKRTGIPALKKCGAIWRVTGCRSMTAISDSRSWPIRCS